MKQEMVGNVPGNVLGMIADLAHKLQHGVILPEEFGRFLKREDTFGGVDVVQLVAAHQSFYRQFFGLDVDFSQVRIPESRAGFDRLIVVVQGLTLNQIYKVCEKNFKCWRYYDNLDAVIDWDKEERNPNNGHYAIWVRDRVEADEELKNLSANQIKERGLTTETLTERKLHGFKYWSETKEHLDRNSITLCAGSCCQGGGVPGVGWDGHYGEVSVSVYGPDGSFGNLRVREVVS